YRIALLRHGAAGAAAFVERLEYFGDFGLHQELHVGRKLAERTGDERQEAADLADAVADRVPGDFGLLEPEFFHQRSLHLEPVRSERGKRAGGARNLAGE